MKLSVVIFGWKPPMRTRIILLAILLSVTGCSKDSVDGAIEMTTILIDKTETLITAEKYSEITGLVCKVVDETKEEALAVTGIATGLTGGAVATTTTLGVTAVAHSSGAVILTGGAGYIAATLGTAAATTVGVLTAPATIAAAAVSLVAVAGAVYICE